MAALITHFPQSVPVLIVPCGGINYPYFTQAPGLIVPCHGTISKHVAQLLRILRLDGIIPCGIIEKIIVPGSTYPDSL